MRACNVLTLTALLCTALADGCTRPPAPPAAPAVAPASEGVLLRLHRRPGEARRFVATTALTVHLGAGAPPAGDSLKPMMRMTQFVTESVTAVSGDTFTVAFINDSSRTTMPFASVPTPLPDSLDRRGLIMTMRMDSRGRVVAVQMERSVLAEGQRMVMRSMLNTRDSSGASAGLGSAIALPSGPTRVGDTWSDTTPCPGIVQCDAGMVTAHRLDSLVDSSGRRTVVVSSSGDIPRMTVDTPMAMSTGPMHVAGTERLDLEAGWLVERTLTVTGPTRTPMGDMWMRMDQKTTAAAPPVSGSAGAPPAIPPAPSGFLIRPANIPTPTTLDGLIALFKQGEPALEFPRCDLPDATAGAGAVPFDDPERGLHIELPRGWHVVAVETTPFGDPVARLADSGSSRLRLTRVTRASGLGHMMKQQSYGMPTELPHTARCRLGGGNAGSAWTLYAPDPDATSGPFTAWSATGDLITPAGRRYGVSLFAPSAAERDHLVRLLADAALASP